MLTGSIIKSMEANDSAMVSLPLKEVISILGHSILIGFVLALATYFVGRYLEKKFSLVSVGAVEQPREIIGAMNLMFLTVGLCGLMILINNSFLRAFAIVATIAVVRFRVKLDSKALGSAMIFAILAGMACGVRELGLAYISVGVFLLLVGIMLSLLKVFGGLMRPLMNEPRDDLYNVSVQPTGVQAVNVLKVP